MTTEAVHLRLRVTDPARWQALALSWRRWAALAGRLAAEFGPRVVAVGAGWRGAASAAAARRLDDLRRRLTLFRLHCWLADQVASEFAAALSRARALLGHDRAAALALADRADHEAADRLGQLTMALRTPPQPPPGSGRPDCTTSPAEVHRWWSGLATEERNWLLATEAAWLAGLDGLPAADRDIANRLRLDDLRAELDRAIAGATGRDRDRLRAVRDGLAALSDRLADETGPRAYLLRLDIGEEGQAVVALGDPDRATNVLTHVPGMTADLASFGGELARAERVAGRAAELSPQASTSAVLWLGYDAPDFVDEAASARRAEAAGPVLRHFQEGLRAAHEGPPARQVVLGHSYGSLVVGQAAAAGGFAADGVVFVGSPGVGSDSARELRMPTGEVWSTTSRSDVIQYAAVAPGGFVRDLAVAAAVPVTGPWLAFGRPEHDLWFGPNPSDPEFGARVFASAPGSGHAGYWDRGTPSLDTMAAITLGTAR
ncbi:alpha/beta hydrolase family protein [Actinoplanes sp. TRM 88003]|uniref:Alpha/beta hydrolase family protein n=1 Tax=Paractinoplanes aksuensis TaxID=2939490 RepID=A0ABT1DY11_9ACTN|nr:alpha/beta hydrolase [Actinoplanes aksuensis]MCO8275748.1 alpha/beta hydrolase family protein [Actinoplanes aksuensis]